jgi:hypothetical protein
LETGRGRNRRDGSDARQSTWFLFAFERVSHSCNPFRAWDFGAARGDCKSGHRSGRTLAERSTVNATMFCEWLSVRGGERLRERDVHAL